MKIRSAWIFACLILIGGRAFSQNHPLETVRVMQSSFSGVYFPSFSSASYLPFYDNFNMTGSFVNLIPTGNNANIYWGLTHSIDDSVVLPAGLGELTAYQYLPQLTDDIYAKFNFSFGSWYQVNLRGDYLKNRMLVSNAQYWDYDYDRYSVSLDFTFDHRFSDRENWYKGMVFLYPESGFMAKVGGTYSSIRYLRDSSYGDLFSVFAEAQYLFRLNRFWTLSVKAAGNSFLDHVDSRSQLLVSEVLGAYEIPADYQVKSQVELRYLAGKGLYWDTPPFWLIGSFQLKFTPGFLAGVQGGIAGRLDTGNMTPLYSVYAAPMVALYLNGTLQTVMRMDVAFAGSQNYSVVFSLNFGGGVESTSSKIVQSGL